MARARTFAALAFLLLIGNAVLADSRPVVQQGRCPDGTTSDGEWCTPRKGETIIHNPAGTRCPTGFTMSGDYCVKLERR